METIFGAHTLLERLILQSYYIKEVLTFQSTVANTLIKQSESYICLVVLALMMSQCISFCIIN